MRFIGFGIDRRGAQVEPDQYQRRAASGHANATDWARHLLLKLRQASDFSTSLVEAQRIKPAPPASKPPPPAPTSQRPNGWPKIQATQRCSSSVRRRRASRRQGRARRARTRCTGRHRQACRDPTTDSQAARRDAAPAPSIASQPAKQPSPRPSAPIAMPPSGLVATASIAPLTPCDGWFERSAAAAVNPPIIR